MSTIVLIKTKLHMDVRYPLRMNPIEMGVGRIIGSAAILDFSQKMEKICNNLRYLEKKKLCVSDYVSHFGGYF